MSLPTQADLDGSMHPVISAASSANSTLPSKRTKSEHPADTFTPPTACPDYHDCPACSVCPRNPVPPCPPLRTALLQASTDFIIALVPCILHLLLLLISWTTWLLLEIGKALIDDACIMLAAVPAVLADLSSFVWFVFYCLVGFHGLLVFIGFGVELGYFGEGEPRYQLSKVIETARRVVFGG
ncbi:hypothetical protein HDK64DRAFT_276979 [Phyllosticta capitalensis]